MFISCICLLTGSELWHTLYNRLTISGFYLSPVQSKKMITDTGIERILDKALSIGTPTYVHQNQKETFSKTCFVRADSCFLNLHYSIQH
jgi:hypothetical protein